MLWGSLLRTFSRHYDKTAFKKVSQYLVSSVAVGSIIGLLLASKCADAGGAALCFIIPGIVTLIMALAVRLFLPDTQGSAKEKFLSVPFSCVRYLRRQYAAITSRLPQRCSVLAC